jgi:hypothetical protein
MFLNEALNFLVYWGLIKEGCEIKLFSFVMEYPSIKEPFKRALVLIREELILR